MREDIRVESMSDTNTMHEFLLIGETLNGERLSLRMEIYAFIVHAFAKEVLWWPVRDELRLLRYYCTVEIKEESNMVTKPQTSNPTQLKT